MKFDPATSSPVLGIIEGGPPAAIKGPLRVKPGLLRSAIGVKIIWLLLGPAPLFPANGPGKYTGSPAGGGGTDGPANEKVASPMEQLPSPIMPASVLPIGQAAANDAIGNDDTTSSDRSENT